MKKIILIIIILILAIPYIVRKISAVQDYSKKKIESVKERIDDMKTSKEVVTKAVRYQDIEKK